MDLHIYRPFTSSYQDSHFFLDEEKRLRRLVPELHYGLPEVGAQGPVVLITNTQTQLENIPEYVAEKVKLIIHPNSGHDNLSRSWAQERQIPVVLGNPIRAQAVAEYILSCLYHRFASLPVSAQWDPGRRWPRTLLKEQRVLLIGLGHVGKILFKNLSEMCAEVSVYDPPLGYVELKPTQHDVLIFACDLNPTSHHLLGAELLAQMPAHLTVINAARGDLIQEEALLSFLSKHPDARAYLDVYSTEPYPRAFPRLHNLFCTSHQAGVFAELDEKILQFEERVVADFISLNPVEFADQYHSLLLEHRPNYERMERV